MSVSHNDNFDVLCDFSGRAKEVNPFIVIGVD
jgi:hypothetical protein